MREQQIETTTHGRVLIDDPAVSSACRVLTGFHGYGQNADEMLAWLNTIPGAAEWTRVSVQGLHRFYRGRSQTTVASWMVRQDREHMIADNVRYCDAALAGASGGRGIDRLIVCGFSQGVSMAFRAGVRGARPADAILALGGDVPPELLADSAVTFPTILLARGNADPLHSADKMQRDADALAARGVQVETMTFDGGHEWSAAFAAAAARALTPSTRIDRS